jgi:N-acetylmuramoyl-L-alanine amidase
MHTWLVLHKPLQIGSNYGTIDNVNTPSAPSPAREPTAKAHARGPFYHLQLVIGVAALLATLFTASTPSGLLPGKLGERLAILLPATPQPAAQATRTPLSDLRIGIVAGHSGNDSGAVCANGTTEAQVNLDIATRLKADLENRGYVVDLLKEFDPLLKGYKAAALVSIHADSCDYINDEATGFKVAASFANQRPEQSARLVNCLRIRYGETTGLPFHSASVTPDMSSYHAFEEIDPTTASAIIEVGFLNLDYQFLTQQPEKVADGVARGIVCYVTNENIIDASKPAP